MKPMIILILLLLVPPAFSATLKYTFATADIPVPGQPGQFTFPEDINDAGAVVANMGTTAVLGAPVIRLRVRTYKPTPFNCDNADTADTADTAVFAINNAGQIAGYCSGVAGSPTKSFGFIRNRNGRQTLLDFPGADGSAVFGINNLGHAVGQFYGPLNQPRGSMAYRFHCFTWIRGVYRQIDFPRDNTYVSCTAINNKGQVLGEYITVTDGNEYLEHGWFIYDNGNFLTEFPLSFGHVGGPGLYLIDMNNDGQILGQRSDGGVFLYDDGIFHDVEFPADYHSPDVRGLNNKGQFVGIYRREVGADEYGPRYEAHGYVATPSR